MLSSSWVKKLTYHIYSVSRNFYRSPLMLALFCFFHQDKEPIKVIYSTDIKDARKAPW